MAGIKLTKGAFLEALRLGKGVKQICREYGYKSTSTPHRWRQKDPEFKAAWDKILDSPMHRERISLTNSRVGETTGVLWIDSYFEEFRSGRDRVAAADAAGKTVTFTINACDPTSPEYDEVFAVRMREEMLREAVGVEDELKKKATIENSVQMQKWIIPYLPVVGEKYYRGAENRLKKTEEHKTVVFFQDGGLKSATKLLNGMFGEKEI